jgi:hypothetical protein
MATSRPFAYNTGSTLPFTEQVGDIAIGTGGVEYAANYGGLKWWGGPDEDLGYVITHTVPDGNQPNPLNIPAYLGFWRSPLKTEGSFVSYTNFIFGTSFTTGDQCNTYLNANGYWSSYTNPIIVPTSGLTLYVDAGQSLSYSGSGNQWYDLSGNNNTGTLQNSPTYSSSNGGTLTFNGSNQYTSFSSPTNIPIGNSNYTISVWFNAASIGGNAFIGWGNFGVTSQVTALRLYSGGFIHYWWGNDLVVPTSLSINTWYNVVARFNGTNREIWLNNVKIGNDTPSGHNVPNANNLRIASSNGGEYFNGKISNVEIYNRAISDSEIAQIYNNLSSRFLP